MIRPPAFFERVRRKAAERWDQLERDADLAGPWHQLFKQVQSPRHVLSELLQNADDAGATEATARIENGVFVFEHDGEDFTEEQFESLCRFGYSNKRVLHTIGFRGVGFKSTFSLGDPVEVHTPTLSVCFCRRRFTEPRWIEREPRSDGKTCIRVPIADEHRKREVERNLDEWRRSPLSLLFFRNIRSLRVGEGVLRWQSLGPGPVDGSEWVTLGEEGGPPLLVIRSDERPFPPEALEEIREERMLAEEDVADFPHSRVEIVLGVEGRLFVVLPTGVATSLPFACNAPFIQDPARLEIKDPASSPTNRWLLERAGELAGRSMLAWLERRDLSAAERARAYGLFPDVDRKDDSLEGVCARLVEESFEESITDRAFLLDDKGELVPWGHCVALPEEIAEVWPPMEAATFFDREKRRALSRHVTRSDRRKLLNWKCIEQIDRDRVLAVLESESLPRPKTWHQLLQLWVYVDAQAISSWREIPLQRLRIVPVEGKKRLDAGNQVVRLGEKKLVDGENDWGFLSQHLAVLHHEWPKFLAEERARAEKQEDRAALKMGSTALAVLEKLGLDRTTDVNKVIDRVAAKLGAEGGNLADWVRLAQVAAKLHATVSENFRYVTRDGKLRGAESPVLFDGDGLLEDLLPEDKRESLLLHQDYVRSFRSCTAEEWAHWVASGRARLLSFPPLGRRRYPPNRPWCSRREIEAELRRRGVDPPAFYPYVTDRFFLVDWDFEDDYWEHWKKLAEADARIWVAIGKRILAQPVTYWSDARRAQLFQLSRTRKEWPIPPDDLLPSWVLRLREVPCLPDTKGFCRKPAELFRRTPETEALWGIEAFVHSALDTEKTRELLDLLGVQSRPTGPEKLLERLRALTRSEKPPLQEVERWYRQLDQMLTTCSTQDFQKIREAFHSERLILTDKGTWANVSSVFQRANEEDVPDAPVIREPVADLALWHRLGVAERPTVDLAVRWLEELPKGEQLERDVLRRVRALLGRHPVRIWEECRAWLNLAGEWVAVEELSYALTIPSLIPWEHLDEWVKRRTANFQDLPREVTGRAPFSQLRELSTVVEERLHGVAPRGDKTERPAWLTTLGSELCRIELEDPSETERVRALAQRLARTLWQRTPRLESIPYIEGTPAGTPRRADVLWLDSILYVTDLPKPKLAKRVPEEIAKPFGRPEIKAALDYSFDRSPDDVRAYLEENFELAPAEAAGTADAPAVASSSMTESGDGTRVDVSTAASPSAHSADQDGEERLASPSQSTFASVDESTDQEVGGREAPEGPRLAARADRPDIIERFAVAQGFRKESQGRFSHPDGSSISRTMGNPFPWERRNASGNIVRCYWPKEHCLDLEPLEIDAEMWWMLENRPDLYALILEDASGNPVEITGVRLRKLRERGKLKLYPATYRLVVESHENA